MVTNGALATLISAISALLYGLLFSFITFLVGSMLKFTQILIGTYFAKKHDKEIEINKTIDDCFSRPLPLMISVIEILLFGIGFSVVSFLSLDGRLRLYTAFFSVLGCWIIDRFIATKYFHFISSLTGKILFLINNRIRKSIKCAKIKNILRKKSKNTPTNDLHPS